jgi:hypothetical protein
MSQPSHEDDAEGPGLCGCLAGLGVFWMCVMVGVVWWVTR